MPIPNAYYLSKRQIISHLRRWKRILQDGGSVESKLLESNFDCLLIFESHSASTHYRVTHASESLTNLGFTPLELSLADLDRLSRFDWLDKVRLILLHRIPMNRATNKLLRTADTKSIATILDLDDAIHDPKIYSQSAVFDHLSSVEQAIHRDLALRIYRSAQRVNAITTSTGFLADLVRKTCSQVHVIPNRISQTMIDASGYIAQSHPDPPIIGYMSGTSTHHRDFETILNPLIQCMLDYPETQLVLAGPLQLPSHFTSEFSQRINRLPLTSWPGFLQYYSQLSINLAPLEPNNTFCQAKSGIKYLEAALSAVPTVAASTPDFCRLITPDLNGLIARTDEDWYTSLSALLSDDTHRTALGIAARNHTLSTETTNQNDVLWSDLMLQMKVYP